MDDPQFCDFRDRDEALTFVRDHVTVPYDQCDSGTLWELFDIFVMPANDLKHHFMTAPKDRFDLYAGLFADGEDMYSWIRAYVLGRES